MTRPSALGGRTEPDTAHSGRVSPRDRAEVPVDPDAGTGPAPRATRPWVHRRLDVLAAVAAGGAIGNLARYGISRTFPVDPGRFPTSTLVINTSGSFVLGLVLVLLIERLPPSRYARAFLAVGIVGAFTTFSTFAVEAAQLVADQHVALAATFVVTSIGAGLAAAQLGILAGRVVPHRHPPPPRHPREEPT